MPRRKLPNKGCTMSKMIILILQFLVKACRAHIYQYTITFTHEYVCIKKIKVFRCKPDVALGVPGG
jgi:hypothetical protein